MFACCVSSCRANFGSKGLAAPGCLHACLRLEACRNVEDLFCIRHPQLASTGQWMQHRRPSLFEDRLKASTCRLPNKFNREGRRSSDPRLFNRGRAHPGGLRYDSGPRGATRCSSDTLGVLGRLKHPAFFGGIMRRWFLSGVTLRLPLSCITGAHNHLQPVPKDRRVVPRVT